MVLEAWYKAEKIEYPVVGEKTKESSDVIDYDIHDEITIDTSSVFNANNDTTIGMATVIPGVNAPQLIQTTSIYTRKNGYVGAEISYTSNTISPGNIVYIYNGTVTITNSGEYDITQNSAGSLSIPVAGYYHLDITLPTHGTYYYWNTTITTRTNRGVFSKILEHTGETGSTSDVVTTSVDVQFTEGSTLSWYCEYIYVGSGTGGNRAATLSIDISKLG